MKHIIICNKCDKECKILWDYRTDEGDVCYDPKESYSYSLTKSECCGTSVRFAKAVELKRRTERDSSTSYNWEY